MNIFFKFFQCPDVHPHHTLGVNFWSSTTFIKLMISKLCTLKQTYCMNRNHIITPASAELPYKGTQAFKDFLPTRYTNVGLHVDTLVRQRDLNRELSCMWSTVQWRTSTKSDNLKNYQSIPFLFQVSRLDLFMYPKGSPLSLTTERQDGVLARTVLVLGNLQDTKIYILLVCSFFLLILICCLGY